MNPIRLLAAAVFVAAVFAGSAMAQGAGAPLPATKIAIVDTSVFPDEKQGITRLVTLVKRIKSELQKQQDDVDQVKTRITTLSSEYQKLQVPNANVTVLRSKQFEIEGLQREYEYKAKELQLAYGKRINETGKPVTDDIAQALDAFAKQRGITFLLDASKFEGLIYVSPEMDLTKSFIADYNARNPK